MSGLASGTCAARGSGLSAGRLIGLQLVTQDQRMLESKLLKTIW
jgi:hypothetical protein